MASYRTDVCNHWKFSSNISHSDLELGLPIILFEFNLKNLYFIMQKEKGSGVICETRTAVGNNRQLYSIVVIIQSDWTHNVIDKSETSTVSQHLINVKLVSIPYNICNTKSVQLIYKSAVI